MVLTVGADTPSISRSVEDIKDEPCLPQHIFDENNVEWNINGFENIKEIGRGKDTRIYSATCAKIPGKEVAVKVYDKDKVSSTKLRAIKREVAMMLYFAKKRVPHVVELYGAFADANHYYLVMELCPGGDLLEILLREKRAMNESSALTRVILPILEALCRLHELKIVHRDIKLENIFLDEQGNFKLGDFGLTMSMRQESAISPVGTVEYMAPEVVSLPPVESILKGRVSTRDITPNTEKVDIWALGVTLFELIAGKLPFNGGTKQETKEAILNYRMCGFPSFITRECKGLLLEMLTYFPHDRPSANKIKECVAKMLLERHMGPTKNVVTISAHVGSTMPMELIQEEGYESGSDYAIKSPKTPKSCPIISPHQAGPLNQVVRSLDVAAYSESTPGTEMVAQDVIRQPRKLSGKISQVIRRLSRNIIEDTHQHQLHPEFSQDSFSFGIKTVQRLFSGARKSSKSLTNT